MELEEKRRLLESWRGRRLLVCRAIETIDSAIENLGTNEGDPYPEGFDPEVSDSLKRELQNSAANLLRLFLILNDGHVSSQKLPRF